MAEPRRGILETPLVDAVGVRFTPAGGASTGVLVLAGSSGRVDRDRARRLADEGVVTESVQWFGGPRQPVGPTRIPLEFFATRLEGLRRETDRVVLVGTSFGAEAALATAALANPVDAVVAFAPSDVVWAGVLPDGQQTSHWSLGGVPVPFVPLGTEWEPTDDPPAFRGHYLASRRADPEAVAAATIPVERIPRLLLVAGGDDQVWPSDLHAESIRARRNGFGLDTQIVHISDAGHRAVLPGEPTVTGGVFMARGGSPEADAALGALAWGPLRSLLHAQG